MSHRGLSHWSSTVDPDKTASLKVSCFDLDLLHFLRLVCNSASDKILEQWLFYPPTLKLNAEIDICNANI